MLVRRGSGLIQSERYVLRPITTGLSVVSARKCAMSDFSRHGIVPPLPTTPFSATAAMRTISITRVSPRRQPRQRIAGDAHHGPLVHQYAAERLVEIDRGRVPVEHRP